MHIPKAEPLEGGSKLTSLIGMKPKWLVAAKRISMSLPNRSCESVSTNQSTSYILTRMPMDRSTLPSSLAIVINSHGASDRPKGRTLNRNLVVPNNLNHFLSPMRQGHESRRLSGPVKPPRPLVSQPP